MELATAIRRDTVLIGDLVLAEVLRGSPNERVAATLAASLSHFNLAELGGRDVAEEAAEVGIIQGAGVAQRGNRELPTAVGEAGILHASGGDIGEGERDGVRVAGARRQGP